VYVTGVETVEFDNVVTVDDLRTAEEVDGVVTSVLNGLSCEKIFEFVLDGHILIVRSSSLAKSVTVVWSLRMST
jgi:hypothetical protein